MSVSWIAFSLATDVQITLHGDAWLLLLYLSLALGVSFLCSLLEAGLLSIPLPYVEVLVSQGKKSGRILRDFKGDIDRPLAAILTLNTVAHTIGAAGVGAQILVIFGDYWVAAGSAIVTLMILVFSEIIPKTLGAVHAKRLAPFTAWATGLLVLITLPIVIPLDALSKMLGANRRTGMTRDEVETTALLGETAGALAREESQVIVNLLRLREIRVEDVMTPRAVVAMLERNTTVGEAASSTRALRFSRIPVYDSVPDRIVGMALRHQILQMAHADQVDRLIHDIIKPVSAVPETLSVAHALRQFTELREHLFIVVDEFGDVEGIITLEDAVETLLGVEIVDETDSVEDMRKLARRMHARRRAQRLAETDNAGRAPAENETDVGTDVRWRAGALADDVESESEQGER